MGLPQGLGEHPLDLGVGDGAGPTRPRLVRQALQGWTEFALEHKMRAWLDSQRDWITVDRLPAYPPELNPAEYLWANLKGGELANCTGDTVAEVADHAHQDIQRVCDSDSLVVGFLAHIGPSLDDDDDDTVPSVAA
jgi:hypothetical protein